MKNIIPGGRLQTTRQEYTSVHILGWFGNAEPCLVRSYQDRVFVFMEDTVVVGFELGKEATEHVYLVVLFVLLEDTGPRVGIVYFCSQYNPFLVAATRFHMCLQFSLIIMGQSFFVA